MFAKALKWLGRRCSVARSASRMKLLLITFIVVICLNAVGYLLLTPASYVENRKFDMSHPECFRVTTITPERFFQEYFVTQTPLVITDMLVDDPAWTAFDRWTSNDYMRSKLGNATVGVNVNTKTTGFGYDSEGVYMQFSDFLNAAFPAEGEPQGVEQGKHMYMNLQKENTLESSLAHNHLREDFRIPYLLRWLRVDQINLWMGTDKVTSQTHYDSHPNLLVQVQGTKSLLLFPPTEYRNLYVNGEDPTHPSFSEVEDVEDHAANAEVYPKVKNAKHLTCKLRKGEMLWLPPRWFHQVTSIGARNVAINFWFAFPERYRVLLMRFGML